MSDNVLLTSLWLVPVIGMVVVLALPARALQLIKWVSLGFTSLTFVITLVVLGLFVTAGLQSRSLRDRVVNNKVVGTESGQTSDESGPGESDLVVRRAWVPYFNIQYYLGV